LFSLWASDRKFAAGSNPGLDYVTIVFAQSPTTGSLVSV
jgi:hypothetical protein